MAQNTNPVTRRELREQRRIEEAAQRATRDRMLNRARDLSARQTEKAWHREFAY